MGFAAWYLATFRAQFPASVYLMLTSLPFLLGVLFLLDWWYRETLRMPSTLTRPR